MRITPPPLNDPPVRRTLFPRPRPRQAGNDRTGGHAGLSNGDLDAPPQAHLRPLRLLSTASGSSIAPTRL